MSYKISRFRAIPVLFFGILLSALFLLGMTPDQRYVAAPGLACVLMMLWLWMILWNRDKKIPFFDIGVFCAMATFVYTVYPLINYWIGGFQFGILSDARLHAYNISPAEIGVFHLRHVLYLFSFITVYLLFRGRGRMETGNVRCPGYSTRHAIVLVFLILTAYFFFLKQTTGVDFNVSYAQEAYSNNMSALARLPLLLLQVSLKLKGVLFVFKLALLFIVVCRCNQNRWLIILLLWIAVETLQTIYIKGARTNLVLFLIAAALFYHRMIRPFTMKFLVASGAVLFVLFILMGLFRVHKDFHSFKVSFAGANANIFSAANEFQSLFGTEYDVLQRKSSGATLPWYLYINDFIAILPPRQLMPFEKIRASDWYLQEIGISGTGQGLMWGVISQAIIGLDWFELAFRGTLLGYILAKFHRWYLKNQSSFFATLLYTFFCIKIYYTFRDTTGAILTDIIWEVIPFYILLGIASAFIASTAGGHYIGHDRQTAD